ncbi:hypothetical protein [Bdellovibrio reynosensis]|uniref:DUF2726 domain-containing protein n=1 Tax=Bdellovibrio reynosensis TaxID=2835041 RepID=A0ABY4CD29_9BACT|nr:hypothetical protein [Bdellovibrio reynosensis]UOF02354.1 hypothetical protein MNR06_05240 [Bdellovibrio reynosensis]
MDLIVFALSLSVFILGLAVFANRARARKDIPFELTPNCLLTRWPILFVTGPRSIFYFSKFWNLHPVFLTEHGYEVFTVHLPWKNADQRRQRFEEFLSQQENHKRHFHLVVDSPTFTELESVLRGRRSSAIKSITEMTDDSSKQESKSLFALPVPFATIECRLSKAEPKLLKLSYRLHKYMVKPIRPASLSTLGAIDETAIQNCQLLLERASNLAEMDLRDET